MALFVASAACETYHRVHLWRVDSCHHRHSPTLYFLELSDTVCNSGLVWVEIQLDVLGQIKVVGAIYSKQRIILGLCSIRGDVIHWTATVEA